MHFAVSNRFSAVPQNDGLGIEFFNDQKTFSETLVVPARFIKGGTNRFLYKKTFTFSPY